MNPEDTATPAPEGAGFASILAEANQVESEAPGATPEAAPGAPVPAPFDHATVRELLAALQMARALAAGQVEPLMADFAVVWSDSQLRQIAEAGAEVMNIHGWSVGELMGRWGPYIRLAVAVGVPGWVTWQAIKQAQRRPAQRGPDGSAGKATD